MAHCPTCRREYDDEVKTCPEDQDQLVEELPYQTIESEDGTIWVEIASVGTEDEATLIRGFLEAEEIPAQIESLRFSMEPVNFGQMGDIRIYVPAQHEERAFNLIRQRELSAVNLPDDQISTDEGPAEIDERTGSESE